MSTFNDAWQAGIDAVILDNTINRGDFADAIRTVVTINFSNADATDWIDAVAIELERVGAINNPTFNSVRGHIIDDAVQHRALFDSLSTISQIPEGLPAISALNLLDLREQRDNIDAAIDRVNVLIAAEPGGVVGRLVKEILRDGKNSLRGHKEQVRNDIRNITGDPDS